MFTVQKLSHLQQITTVSSEKLTNTTLLVSQRKGESTWRLAIAMKLVVFRHSKNVREINLK